MTNSPRQIQMIPIDAILIANPRARNPKVHQEITENIQLVGLKRPITVRRIPGADEKYALVCGQGRVESFRNLGQSEIPAIVIAVDEETGHVMSIVENVARRNPRTSETLMQVAALRDKGYSAAEIGKKIGCSASWVNNVTTLIDKGEKRLLAAAEAGYIPLHIAVSISRANNAGAQEILLEAFEKGELKGKKLSVMRGILEQRGRVGKDLRSNPLSRNTSQKRLSADELIKLYKQDAEKHLRIQKKAAYTRNKLLVIGEIFKELYATKDFVDLLKNEELACVPQPLVDIAHAGGLM